MSQTFLKSEVLAGDGSSPGGLTAEMLGGKGDGWLGWLEVLNYDTYETFNIFQLVAPAIKTNVIKCVNNQ